MNQNSSSNFAIRQFVPNDTNRVIFIWEQCDLVRNWNNPNFDIQRKLNFQKRGFGKQLMTFGEMALIEKAILIENLEKIPLKRLEIKLKRQES